MSAIPFYVQWCQIHVIFNLLFLNNQMYVISIIKLTIETKRSSFPNIDHFIFAYLSLINLVSYIQPRNVRHSFTNFTLCNQSGSNTILNYLSVHSFTSNPYIFMYELVKWFLTWNEMSEFCMGIWLRTKK